MVQIEKSCHLHLNLLSRTLIRCFIFLLPYTEMTHPIPSGTREAKGLAQDCTASYWQSAKAFTPRPVSFYHVPRNKAPGRWLWRKVNVPMALPRTRMMFLCWVLRTLNTDEFSPGSGLRKVGKREGGEEGQSCRVLAPECSQVYKLLIQHQHPGHDPSPSHYHFSRSHSRVPQPSDSILSHTGDKACGGLAPTHYGLNCVLLKFTCGIPS